MRRPHLVSKRLGQICVGMIHKFIPPKAESPVSEKRGLGDLTIKEADDMVKRQGHEDDRQTVLGR